MNDFAPTVRPSRKTLVLSLLGLAAFLAVEALLLRHYTRIETRPPAWDQSIHLEIAQDYQEALAARRFADLWYLAPKPGMPPFPPAYHLMLRGASSSAEPARAALWVNWGYLAVLALSLFAIAWRFLPDGRALAAALAFCAAPGLQDLLTTQLVDLAVVALAAAAYWALLESEGFTAWLPSLAFGALHAAGMLHKWSFFSYMFPAYFVAAGALGDRRARTKALAAAALSAALFAPWYWSHLALLPSRLVQASADFAVPFWKDYAWASYLLQSCASLGPLLWLFGLIGLLAPQYARRRETAWLLTYWIATSYVFWMIVPNRQMRFLLPGLAPLGLFLAATWPRALVWGVAGLQLAGMVNFFFGFLGPLTVSLPVVPLTFFVNQPPQREDWKLAEILSRVESSRDPTRPLTNLTLVANDERFNGPTLHWMQRRLHLPNVRMRGVNKRLCELSEFVLLKNGRLGPESVIGGLPEAAQVIAEPGGWFSRAYEILQRWPLPDGSEAVLFRQRRGRARPVSRQKIHEPALQSADVRIFDMNVDFGPWDRGLSAWGRTDARIGRIDLRGLAVRDVSAVLENLSFVPLYEGAPGVFDWNELRLMRLDRVSVRGLRVEADDLKAFIERRAPGLKLDSLTLDGTVKASGRWNGKPVSAEAALDLDAAAHRLRVRVLSASYMGLSVPTILFRPIKELDLSLAPNPETPFSIDLPGLTIRGGRLTIP